jgi:hypothetical protein
MPHRKAGNYMDLQPAFNNILLFSTESSFLPLYGKKNERAHFAVSNGNRP